MTRGTQRGGGRRSRVGGLAMLGPAPRLRANLTLAFALVLAGCTSMPASGGLPTATAGSPPPTSSGTLAPAPPSGAPTAPASAAISVSPSLTSETRPPAMTLRDSAGRAVEAQVGTFQWEGVVSDSPLLAGAPATVGVGQDLTISGPGPLPSSWRATLYRDPADPASGRPFGEGAAPVRLRGPTEPGTWTLALQLVYPAGDVMHFWRLTVAG